MAFLRRQPVVLQYPPLTPLATFLGTDTTTQGTWVGTYGANGYIVSTPTSSGSASLPSGWTWGITGNSFFTYSSYQVAAAEPEKPGGGGGFLDTWYANSPGTMAITITQVGITPYHLEFYLAEGDPTPNDRSQTLTFEDANSNVLDGPRSFSSFGSGVWAKYFITGSIKIIITPTAPINSGIALVVAIDP